MSYVSHDLGIWDLLHPWLLCGNYSLSVFRKIFKPSSSNSPLDAYVICDPLTRIFSYFHKFTLCLPQMSSSSQRRSYYSEDSDWINIHASTRSASLLIFDYNFYPNLKNLVGLTVVKMQKIIKAIRCIFDIRETPLLYAMRIRTPRAALHIFLLYHH